jgi:hypothetical protein
LFELYAFLLVKFFEKIILTLLLVGTLGVIFFAIFFREPPRIVKVRDMILANGFLFFSIKVFLKT